MFAIYFLKVDAIIVVKLFLHFIMKTYSKWGNLLMLISQSKQLSWIKLHHAKQIKQFKKIVISSFVICPGEHNKRFNKQGGVPFIL